MTCVIGSYKVTNADVTDYGTYMCTATNIYGTATKYVTIAQ